MAKYVLKYQELQRGDIILDREDTRESKTIRAFTRSDYSHARIYVKDSVMEANGLGVQAVNPQRIIYDSPDDVVVLRCKDISEEQKIKACMFARSEFAKEYNMRGIENTQFCFRLVSEAYQYAGIEIVPTPNRATVNDFLNCNKLERLQDMVREASEQDLKIAYGEGVMKDLGHYNRQTETAAEMFGQIRAFVTSKGGDAVSIQDDGLLFSFLVENPQYDEGVLDILSSAEYFQLWKEHERTHPWELDPDALMKQFGESAESVARQILDSCKGDNVIAWGMMFNITKHIYEVYHLESAKFYSDFYENLLTWNDKRALCANAVLSFVTSSK